MKANINFADKVVILSPEEKSTSNNNAELAANLMNNEVLYIYKAIQKVNKDVQVIMELVHSQNIQFVLEPNEKFSAYNTSTLYAAG